MSSQQYKILAETPGMTSLERELKIRSHLEDFLSGHAGTYKTYISNGIYHISLTVKIRTDSKNKKMFKLCSVGYQNCGAPVSK